MEAILQQKLHDYIVSHNPELLLKLQENFSLTTYISDKVAVTMAMVKSLIQEGRTPYDIEELALQEMTAELRPSKFLYLKNILEEEFPDEYNKFSEAGVLTYELVNLIDACQEIFQNAEFSEANEDNRFLRYAVIAQVHDYLL
ncbi:MAG: hypothetical protein P0Y49_09395 [Candidatus Pedobacter colombiensis]|uniref:DUF1896 family protein n=1 Tax=Candidatus Pedobacter colombiensis TaxID=3121371 RepID=A0AAJ5WBC7_9SPHI|nr:hypothetical protein [Pedobacter sp.]WEK21354.1 MAG: hypothetical protein P0Y49_09395 [Pedobacter sp.]